MIYICTYRIVALSASIQRMDWFALNSSFSRRSHVSSLCTNEEQKTSLFATFLPSYKREIGDRAETTSTEAWLLQAHSRGQGRSSGLITGGDVAQLVERRTGTPLTKVRFLGAARDFSSRVNFQCRLSYGVRTPPVCNRMH